MHYVLMLMGWLQMPLVYLMVQKLLDLLILQFIQEFYLIKPEWKVLQEISFHSL